MAVNGQRPDNPLVTLVVPVRDEENAVEPLVQEVQAALRDQDFRWEVVFVNDGSQDRTLTRLLQLSHQDHRVRVVNLSRAFGKEEALSAGLDFARGDAVVPIDVDLQDPPLVIPAMVERWRQGFDVVLARRKAQGGETGVRRWLSWAFFKVFNCLSPIQLPEGVGDFRLLDRRVVEVVRRLPERNRLMKGLFAWVGFSTTQVVFERPPVVGRRSRWSGWRLWNLALDGLAGFSTVPLRVWTYVGFGVALAAFIYAGFIVVRTLALGVDWPGYASLMAAVLFLGGVQLICLGVIGEYLGRLFHEVKQRPLYVVEGVYEHGQRQ